MTKKRTKYQDLCELVEAQGRKVYGFTDRQDYGKGYREANAELQRLILLRDEAKAEEAQT